MKKIICIVCILALCLGTVSGCAKKEVPSASLPRLERDDWNDDVKDALNSLLDTYGKGGNDPADSPYAVFDFDNTCSIFDIEEQTVVYQIQTMSFEIKPGEMRDILITGVPDIESDVSSYGYFSGSLADLADDISSEYSALWDKYGPFTYKGISDEAVKAASNDPDWQDFSAKLFVMYDALDDICSSDVSYPWMTYLFAGMTDEELYDLSSRALSEYSGKETSEVTWVSPENYASKTGPVSYTWTSGVSVSENINELWRALDENGIDIWVCSASVTGVIRAAIDHFGLHDHCRGMLGMTDRTDSSGRFINEYDYENGCGYYAKENGWERMSRPTKTQTQGKGKVIAISNAIAPEYGGHGPIAGFMDSTGDFNFCSEFETLKLVVCFNRATRGVTEGGGLIAETAVYQKESLGYDLAKANAAGDTFYVLQGRDENGLRTLRNSNSTVRYGSGEEILFKGSENYSQLQHFKDEGLSTADILNSWSIKKKAEANGLGFDTGFLDSYDGYHSHK